MEIKSEADTNDITECSHDDKPSTGMFAVSDDEGALLLICHKLKSWRVNEFGGLGSYLMHVCERCAVLVPVQGSGV